MVIATPGRLVDFCKGDPSKDIPATITLADVSYLVLDEADRMLDMGFEPDIRKIVEGCQKVGTQEEVLAGKARQTLFFTATWPVGVQRIAAKFTNGKAMQVRIGQGASGNELTANSSVTQTVIVLEENEKFEKLKHIIATEMQGNETAIVFAMRKATCDVLQNDLLRATIPTKRSGRDMPLLAWCRAIHGDREQWERDQSLTAFRAMSTPDAKQLGRKAVLVATDVASRGLDIPGVSLIVVYDFGGEADRPGVESYVHRIGRTGRAGKLGRSFTLFTTEDAGAAPFVELLKGAGQEIPSDLEALAKKDAERVVHKKAKGGKGGKSKGAGKNGKGGGKSKGAGKSGKGGGKGKGKKGGKRK